MNGDRKEGGKGKRKDLDITALQELAWYRADGQS